MGSPFRALEPNLVLDLDPVLDRAPNLTHRILRRRPLRLRRPPRVPRLPRPPRHRLRLLISICPPQGRQWEACLHWAVVTTGSEWRQRTLVFLSCFADRLRWGV